MPDREVSTIRELIFYQYAKIVGRSAFGPDAKKESYGFIKKKFRALKDGTISWSDITREDKQLVGADKACAYCGATGDLQWEHIVPKSLLIKPDCATCDRIQSIHNQVLACPVCNYAKKQLGLYQFYKKRFPDDKKFYDRINPLIEKKYLKTMYCCHECAGTLDRTDLDGDGEITVLDIDAIIARNIEG